MASITVLHCILYLNYYLSKNITACLRVTVSQLVLLCQNRTDIHRKRKNVYVQSKTFLAYELCVTVYYCFEIFNLLNFGAVVLASTEVILSSAC